MLDDPDFDLGVDVGVQPDGNAVDAKGANWLVEIDLALLDLEPLRLQLVGDVGSRHRAESLPSSPRVPKVSGDLFELGRLLGGTPGALPGRVAGAPARCACSLPSGLIAAARQQR